MRSENNKSKSKSKNSNNKSNAGDSKSKSMTNNNHSEAPAPALVPPIGKVNSEDSLYFNYKSLTDFVSDGYGYAKDSIATASDEASKQFTTLKESLPSSAKRGMGSYSSTVPVPVPTPSTSASMVNKNEVGANSNSQGAKSTSSFKRPSTSWLMKRSVYDSVTGRTPGYQTLPNQSVAAIRNLVHLVKVEQGPPVDLVTINHELPFRHANAAENEHELATSIPHNDTYKKHSDNDYSYQECVPLSPIPSSSSSHRLHDTTAGGHCNNGHIFNNSNSHDDKNLDENGNENGNGDENDDDVVLQKLSSLEEVKPRMELDLLILSRQKVVRLVSFWTKLAFTENQEDKSLTKGELPRKVEQSQKLTTFRFSVNTFFT